MARTYKPRGSPRASRSSRRSYVSSMRSASRGAVYSAKRSNMATSRARRIGVKNARTGGLLGVETKYFDTNLANAGIAAPTDASGGEIDPATILCLNGVPQGDTASSRDGFKIAMKSIQVEGSLYITIQVLST